MNEFINITNERSKTISTLEIAEMMEMNHYKILEKLEGTKDGKTKGIIPILTAHDFVVSEYFIESAYKDGSGKENKCYEATRLGCDFLANKFTGEKGILFTAKYVKRFAEMEIIILSSEQLKSKLLLSIYDGGQSAVLASKQLSELEVKEATAPLIAENKELKPKAEFHDTVSNTTNLIDMGKMAKLMKDQHINIGRNRLFQWLRDCEILMYNNVPYQRYIDSGYFVVKESVYSTPSGENRTQQTTYITGKGQIYIIKKYKKYKEAV